MKRFFLFVLLAILYLEMSEIVDPLTGHGAGVFIRVEVTSEEDAIARIPGITAMFFQGKAHKNILHTHNDNAPCTVKELPQ